jgi:hypothetical protein
MKQPMAVDDVLFTIHTVIPQEMFISRIERPHAVTDVPNKRASTKACAADARSLSLCVSTTSRKNSLVPRERKEKRR